MLPKLQKDLLREQLDKHVTFASSLSMNDKIELQDMELEQLSFEAALQHRGNFYTKRHGKVVEEYRKQYGLGDIVGKDNGTEPITVQEMVAVYRDKFPTSLLDEKELEAAASVECSKEMDSIDTRINSAIVGNGDILLSKEQSNMAAFSATRRGIRDKLSNLKRAVITASWK